MKYDRVPFAAMAAGFGQETINGELIRKLQVMERETLRIQRNNR